MRREREELGLIELHWADLASGWGTFVVARRSSKFRVGLSWICWIRVAFDVVRVQSARGFCFLCGHGWCKSHSKPIALTWVIGEPLRTLGMVSISICAHNLPLIHIMILTHRMGSNSSPKIFRGRVLGPCNINEFKVSGPNWSIRCLSSMQT